MPKKTYRAVCEWDSDARVWYVKESNVPGLCADAETLDRLAEKLVAMAQDLLDDEHADWQQVPLELLTRHRMGAHC